jgi:hypothetical protein
MPYLCPERRDTYVHRGYLQLTLGFPLPRYTLVNVLRNGLSCGDELMKVGPEAGRLGINGIHSFNCRSRLYDMYEPRADASSD